MESPNHANSAQTGVGASASTPVLQKAHDDLDILQGCVRELFIQGKKVVSRAFKNREFSMIATILAHFGFATCETPEEVDATNLDELYTNCIIGVAPSIAGAGFNSLEGLLYSLMQFEGDEKADFLSISNDEFKHFFAILIEQNNLLKLAKKNVKSSLKKAV